MIPTRQTLITTSLHYRADELAIHPKIIQLNAYHQPTRQNTRNSTNLYQLHKYYITKTVKRLQTREGLVIKKKQASVKCYQI